MNHLVEILAVLGIFFAPITMVVLIFWFKSSERRKRHQLQAQIAMKALESGQPMPDDLFAELQKPAKKRNPLNTGIICIAVGVGIALAGWFVPSILLGDDMGTRIASLGILGVIPVLIGIAYLLIHFIEKKKRAGEGGR